MNMLRFPRGFPVAIALLAAASTLASPTDPGEHVAVQLRVWATPPGGATQPVAAGSGYVAMGIFDANGKPHPSLLNKGSGGLLTDAVLEDAWQVWAADSRVLSSQVGEVTLEVNWKHYVSGRKGEPRVVGGDTRRIVLREGEHHILDTLSPPSAELAPDSGYANVMVGIEATVEEDPQLASERLRYDLWYEHASADGRKERRRFQAVGRQGEKLDYQFGLLRFSVPDVKLADGTEIDSLIEVSGTLQGRVRRDGSIDLRLGAGRWVSAVIAGEPRQGGIGDGGGKVVSIVPGEAVSLTLPVPQGKCGVGPKSSSFVPSGSRRAVPGEVWVDNHAFYAGHQDSLILTVTRDR
ncbi:MAG TPA: hypothetical protein VJS92_10955 [Candidatus Polarisedimenticolaceae bacterium]|nr:hypothetical protein [Candidatus Polarisedimenticolaceae bacterium]